MTTESQIQAHFLDRFAETHGEPPEGFVAALWKRVGVVTIEQLEAASERIIRTKKAKTFPSFAECLEAIKGAPGTSHHAPSVRSVTPDGYANAAMDHMRRHQTGDMMGCMIEPGTTEWWAWKAYFADETREIPHKVMQNIENVAKQYDRETQVVSWIVTQRYMVPSRWPSEFDASAGPYRDVAA